MRKFVLISPEELARLRTNKNHQENTQEYKIVNPRLNTLMRVDNEMTSTLKNPHLSQEEKAQSYSRDLEEFLTYKNHNSVVASKELKSPVFTGVSTLDISKTAPKTLRNKAERLAELIKDSGKISWDDRGRLIIDGEAMEGTNIIDLINDALRRRKAFVPSGRNYFAHQLRQMNAPRELVGNPSYWEEQVEREGQKFVSPEKTPTKATKRRRHFTKSKEDIDWSTDIDL